MKYVGVDIGGTKIDIVLIDRDGKVFFQKDFLTPKTKKEIIDSIVKTLFEFSHNDVRGIGIGVPGVLNSKMDKIIDLPNLKALNGVNLKKIIEKKTNKEIKLENDANCMCLYAKYFDDGKDVNNFACVTVGTGIGGGIMNNGEIYRGRGSAAEWGHMTLDINKKGIEGEFESLVAKKGFKLEMKKAKYSDKVGFIELEKRILKGDKKAKKVVENVGTKFGVGLSNIIKTIDPEIIFIGGGLAHYGKHFLNPAIKEAKKRTYFNIPKIKLINNLRHAGSMGAASLFF